MDPARLTSLPSLRRQHLLAEFTGLRQACPGGVFVSLTPGDLTLWSGVIFVRNGPYASAILRFQISFPDRYPTLPPLVTFSTDIFHPLVTPLTTYTYTTDIQSGGTVSATDDERLPPGGFSLRHGFPAWFGRGARNQQQGSSPQSSPQSSRQSSGQSAGPPGLQTPPRPGAGSPASAGNSGRPAPPHLTPPPPAKPSYVQTRRPADDVSIYDVLYYLRSTFDDAAVLDAVPLEAAGNPGAWHAWRWHRHQQAPLPESSSGGDSGDSATVAAAAAAAPAPAQASVPTTTAAKKPGEWSWEHVWEERVKNGINVSLSDPVLYGSAGAADDVIRFLQIDDGDIEAIKDNLKRTLGASA